MKKLTLAALAAGLACGAAQASDGTINFVGNLQTTTCAVTPASSSMTVTLPTLATSILASAGATAGRTPFAIAVTGCTGVTTATAYFEPNGQVSMTTGRLSTTGPTGVELRLSNASGSVIDLSKPYGGQGVTAATVASGAATGNFAVEYYAPAATSAGAAAASITYSMVYQ